MFVKVTRNDIIEGLQKSANIIPAKTGAAFLRTIWLSAEEGTLRIMSTDRLFRWLTCLNVEVKITLTDKSSLEPGHVVVC